MRAGVFVPPSSFDQITVYSMVVSPLVGSVLVVWYVIRGTSV
jgi:hypothetical protein